jgi:hypothetical protein
MRATSLSILFVVATTLPGPAETQVPGRVQERPGLSTQEPVTYDSARIHAGIARVEAFARTLPTAERAVWDDLLRSAAALPAADGGSVRIVAAAPVGPGGGCSDPERGCVRDLVGIIVPGGRASSAPAQVDRRVTPRPGIVRSPARAAASEALGARLAEFHATLSGAERIVLDWLLTRAAQAAVENRTAGSAGPVSLRQALGMSANGRDSWTFRPPPIPDDPRCAWPMPLRPPFCDLRGVHPATRSNVP